MSEIAKRSSVKKEGETAVTVTLWARRPVCGMRTVVIDRLHDLAGSDLIADFAVETWPDSVRSDTDSPLLSVVDDFETWADEQSVNVHPPFERKTVSPLVGDSREEVVLPMMTLAVRDDDGLVGVYPCSDGNRTWSVLDYLDACERIGEPPVQSDQTPLPPGG
jgi:hypothetical protein